MTLAGCARDDGGGVPTAGKPTSAGASASRPPTDQERQRQYVDCLRSEGADVAEQQPGQPLTLNNPNDVKTRAAVAACRASAPVGNAADGSRIDPQAQRAFAACMRDKQVTDFPDPDPDRGLQVPKSMTNRPEFQRAWARCQHALKPEGDK